MKSINQLSIVLGVMLSGIVFQPNTIQAQCSADAPLIVGPTDQYAFQWCDGASVTSLGLAFVPSENQYQFRGLAGNAVVRINPINGRTSLGDLTNYSRFSSGGDLQFFGGADMLIGNNQYAFRSSADEDNGLFFNVTDNQYEFRSNDASPAFTMKANTQGADVAGDFFAGGSGVINGALVVNSVPQNDALTRVLVTDVTGLIQYRDASTLGGGGGSLWSASGSNVFYDAGEVAIGTTPVNGIRLIVQQSDPAFGAINFMDDVNDGEITFDGGTDGEAAIRHFGPASGGLNFANASGTALTLRNNGNAGIGTGSPTAKLDVNGTLRVRTVALNNALTQVLVRDGSGNVRYRDAATLAGVPGGEEWSTSGANAILANAGFVGIGTSSPTDKLHVVGGARISGAGFRMCTSADNTEGNVGMGDQLYGNVKVTVSSNQDWGVYVDATTSSQFALQVQGAVATTSGSSWTVVSDARLKDRVQEYTEGLDELLKIRPVKYHYNETSGYNTNKEYVGVIAQELQKVAPYMVRDFKHLKNGNEYLAVDNTAMTYMLINSIKEQQSHIEQIDAENEALKDRMDVLESLVAQLGLNQAKDQQPQLGSVEKPSLGQNVPNPYGSSTMIPYFLPEHTTGAVMVITDIRGSQVASFDLAPGSSRVLFNQQQASGGMLIYTLYVNGQVVDAKIMLSTQD